MADSSIEYTTLLQFKDMLTASISQQDSPLSLASELVNAGLIQLELKGNENCLQASKLVFRIIDTVRASPEKFEAIMAILSQFHWLQDLVKLIHNKYQASGAEKTDKEKAVFTVWQSIDCLYENDEDKWEGH